MSELGELLDLSRPELADVADRLDAGDEEGAAEELTEFYSGRTGIEVPSPGGGGIRDATADELASGIFRFGTETRDFYDDAEQRIDVDWHDTWGGTEENPGHARVLMTDFSFMPVLTDAYLNESDPQKRATYAAAWMDISLDFFNDMQSWPSNRNLSAAKRLAQLVDSFSVFRTEPTIDPSDLVAYLSGVHATTDHLSDVLQNYVGNNWYLSIARAIYVSAVYFPEFSASPRWEPYVVRSVEWFVGRHLKSDSVYREPTFNYHAYVANLLNTIIEFADTNGRSLPDSIASSADRLADALFATRMPNLESALIGDTAKGRAGTDAIRTSGARNSWTDFSWVGSGRTEGTVPTLGSTVYPISYAVQRSGWDSDARYMLINNQNTGYTRSHRHPDDLSLVMAAYGRPLIVDPGVGKDYSSTETNNWMRRTTEAHNTVEVDGRPQEAGVTRATWLWRSNAGLDVYRGEAQGYRPITHDRVVYFVKPGFWIVSDSLTGDADAHDYRQLWHFPGDPVSVDDSTGVATVGFDTVPGDEPVSGVQLVPVGTAGSDVTPTVHDDGAVRVGQDVRTDVDYLSYDWSTTGATGLDTVVVPGKAGPAPSVTAERIELPGVDHSVATALEIDLPEGTGTFYLSREDDPASREFGTAATDGETAYIERDEDGGLTRYSLTSGSSLVRDDASLVDASDVVSDISVELAGDTARISLGDPFTGSLSINAPDADVVLVNGEPAAFTRNGDVVSLSVEAAVDLTPVLEEDFAEASLDSTVYGFDDGSLEGWRPAHGDWALGGQEGTQLAQTSTADRLSFAVQQDVPTDMVMTAEVVPGTRHQTTTRTGLAFRYRDSRNYYRANVLNTSEGVKLQIIKVFYGQLTVLAETDLRLDADAAHTMTVSAVGRHLTATVGDTSISANDTRLPTGGVAAYTHRRAATFDNVTIAEVLDQDHWRGIRGEASVDSGQLRLAANGGRAHVLVDSALPARFSETCNYEVDTTVTLPGRGAAGVSLRDSTDSYGYRIHVGKTSRGTQYASIIREAHRSGPVKVAGTSLSDPLDGPVELGATIHGDRITVTLNGEEILDARDTVVRSGGVGLYATKESTFEDLTVSRSCDTDDSDVEPAPRAWDPATTYSEGDSVTHEGSVWLASWRAPNQEPGAARGPWQEIAVAEDGTALWRPSRIFTEKDEVEYRENRYVTTRRTRNDVPGEPHGPWKLAE
ncbi:heparinase II/III family protein [Haloactinopolyspora alba]|nr:heparinase II/III family protein [Haloactinopolyspora alba]